MWWGTESGGALNITSRQPACLTPFVHPVSPGFFIDNLGIQSTGVPANCCPSWRIFAHQFFSF
jgi:hypothetical protein